MSAKKNIKSSGVAKAPSKAKPEKKSDSGDPQKTKAQLVDEIKKLRRLNAKLKRAEDKRKVAGSEKLEMQEQYRVLFENANDAIMITDAETGMILEANRKAGDLLGRPVSEIIGMHQSEIHPREEAEHYKEIFRKHVDKSGKLPPEQLYLCHKDGNRVPAEVSSTVFQVSGRKLMMGIFRDVTERQKIENALKDSEEMFRSIFEKSPIGIEIYDSDGWLFAANNSSLDIFGVSSIEDLKGFNFFRNPYITDEIKDRLLKDETVKYKAAFDFDEAKKSGLFETGKSGIIYLDMLITPLKGMRTGISGGYLFQVSDVTKREKMEEELYKYQEHLQEVVDERTSELKETAENLELEIIERKRVEEELLRAQKLESVGLLAGGIAHDFNNALTAILNNVFIAKTSLKDEKKALGRLAAAENAVQRAQGLTSQLLTFSMGGEPVKKKCHIAKLVRDTADFAIRGSNVKCEFGIAEDLWPVEADEGQLSQVISNLLINADHAMPEGGTVRVSAANVLLGEKEVSMLEEGRYVKLSVEDHGIGIPKAHLQKIFDPYFTTKQKGSGLGLATSYSIVVKHGGHIAVEPGAESGTTFHIYLPASEDAAVHEEQRVEEKTAGGGKVLLMEDEVLIAKSVVMGLEEFGFKAEHVPDGESAIESYREAKESGAPFDAVVLDLTVPGGMGGREAIKKLREMDPDVKAIVASGYSNDPVMSNFKDYGFRSVLPKPYSIEGLVAELKKII